MLHVRLLIACLIPLGCVINDACFAQTSSEHAHLVEQWAEGYRNIDAIHIAWASQQCIETDGALCRKWRGRLDAATLQWPPSYRIEFRTVDFRSELEEGQVAQRVKVAAFDPAADQHLEIHWTVQTSDGQLHNINESKSVASRSESGESNNDRPAGNRAGFSIAKWLLDDPARIYSLNAKEGPPGQVRFSSPTFAFDLATINNRTVMVRFDTIAAGGYVRTSNVYSDFEDIPNYPEPVPRQRQTFTPDFRGVPISELNAAVERPLTPGPINYRAEFRITQPLTDSELLAGVPLPSGATSIPALTSPPPAQSRPTSSSPMWIFGIGGLIVLIAGIALRLRRA